MNLAKKTKKKKISTLIFSTEKFPYQSPGARRICNLFDSKIIDNEKSIMVIISNSVLINFDDYKFNQLKIFYISKSSKNFLCKILNLISIIIKYIIFINFLFNKYEIGQTYIYSRLGIFTAFLSVFTKIKKTKLIIDNTEWFNYDEINGNLNKFSEFIHRLVSIRVADKYFSIGLNMKKLLLNIYPKKDVKIIYPHPPLEIKSKINFLINKELKSKIRKNNIKTIFYAGSFKMSDDPIFLLDNIIYLSNKLDFKLVIISQNLLDKKLPKFFLNKIDILKKNIGDRNFIIYGYLEDIDFYRSILDSDVLILPRNNKGYSIYNQPMRFSEYALFNKPILTTNIDEQYASCYDNIFLYESCDSDSFRSNLANLILQR